MAATRRPNKERPPNTVQDALINSSSMAHDMSNIPNIGTMQKKMETTIVYIGVIFGVIGIMENQNGNYNLGLRVLNQAAVYITM